MKKKNYDEMIINSNLGATLVDNAIDEELPIRQICKDAFMGPLNNLTSSSGTNQLQVHRH